MKLSVIIPVYNAQENLRRCLNSVVSQSFLNLEILLVNDGSTDDSATICQEFAQRDSRIIVLDQENRGAAAARNSGLRIASGDYVGFVDADDYIEKEMFETLTNVGKLQQVDVVVSNINVHVNSKVIYTLKDYFPNNEILRNNSIRELILFQYFRGNLGNIPSLFNKIYRRDFLANHSLEIDETRIRGEDYWFNFFVFKHAETLYAIKDAFYHYYSLNAGSIMNTFRENQFEYFLKSRMELLEQSKKLKLEVDWVPLDFKFIDDTNEHILFGIKKNGFLGSYLLTKTILTDSHFKRALASISPKRLHTRLIRQLVHINATVFAYLIYYLWSTRLNQAK